MIADDFKDLLPTRKAAHSEPDKRPLYALWVFDPQDAKAHVEYPDQDRPAHFPTHGAMATDVTHPDRLQGYAYSIVGGWRITDEDHHKVEDPFIIKSVLAALRKENPPEPLPSIRYHGDPVQ